MANDYLTINNNITKVIETQLLEADAVPPNAEVHQLATSITSAVLGAMAQSGLTREVIDGFVNSTGAKAKALGTK